MKKILFASTALVAVAMTAGVAQASDPIKLQLGGFSKWWVVGAWQSHGFANSSAATGGVGAAGTGRPIADYQNAQVKGDNEVWFTGSTTLDNGINTGVFVSLEAGGHTDMTTDTIDKSYVFLEGGFGKFILGSNKNAAYMLGVVAPDAAGNWGDGGMISGNFSIAKPSGVRQMGGGNNTLINTPNNAQGIQYYTPKYNGVTLAVGFTPNGYEDKRTVTDINIVGANNSETSLITNPLQEHYTGGILFDDTVMGVGVKASATGLVGHFSSMYLATAASGTVTNQYLPSSWVEWTTGLNLSYAGFTVGGGYHHQQANYGTGAGDSSAISTPSGNGSFGNGHSFDAGVQYATGPYAVSLSFYQSDVQHTRLSGSGTAAAGTLNQDSYDRVRIYQVSSKYTLGPGVNLLSSVGYMQYKGAVDDNALSAAQSASAGSNSFTPNHNAGFVMMSGLSLTF